MRVGSVAETIQLQPPSFQLRVVVKDRHGNVMTNAPVFLKNFVGEDAVPMLPNLSRTSWAAHWLPDAADGSGFVERLGYRIGAGTEDGTSVRLQREHLEGTPVEIQLGACGSLEVHVTAESGRPVPHSVPVLVQRRDRVTRWTPRHFAIDPPHTVNGVATISGIALKQRWLVGAPLLADERYFFVEVDGPEQEGETVRVELDLEATSRVIRGSLTESDGTPLATCRLSASLEMDEPSGGAQSFLRTDVNGAFAYRVPLLPGEAWEQLTLSVWESERQPSTSVEVLLNDELDDQHLGVLRLEPAESRGIVRVLDERGKSVMGATLWIRPLAFQDSGAPGPWLSDGAWNGWLAVKSHSVYGDPPYEVLATHPLYHASTAVLEHEEDSITISMSRAARVRGRVLMPEDCTAAVEILPAMTGAIPWDKAESFESSSATSPYGFFDCGPFYPGTFDLELRIAGILMARVGRVDLRAGATVAPPAFQNLDLRHCTPMRIMLAHAPSRVRNDDLLMHVEYADGSLESLTARTLLLPPEATRVKVEAEGCTPVWLPVSAGTAFVTLELAED